MKLSDRASSRYLTYRHPTYRGCTFQELTLIAGAYMIIDLLVSLMLPVLLSLSFGTFFIFISISILVSIVLFKFTATKIGKIKAGKPSGYLILSFRYWLHRKFGFSIPFIIRTGKWKTRRSLQ